MFNRYTLQAKRPHEKVYTEWCSSDSYEDIERNIKVIESYGWQWQLKEDNKCTEREQRLLERLIKTEMRLRRLIEWQTKK